VNDVRFNSVEQIHQREAGDSDGEFDEGDAGDDVNRNAFEIRARSSWGNDGHVVPEVSLVSRHPDDGIGDPVELGEKRFRYDDKFHTHRFG
jgi:hypothetical protein